VNISLTDTLCTHCGLCCDGSLFADVELASSAEASSLEVLGLDVEEDVDANLLLQPCAALNGKRCGIYPHRPECCRTFECRLLQDVRQGAVTVAHAQDAIAETLKKVERVRKLAAHLGQHSERLPLKERCADALEISEDCPRPDIARKREELEAAMNSVERLIQETFLRQRK
jgi:uncharacterized protein